MLSRIASARPASTSRTSCSGWSPNRMTIRSGLPSGCAACDHSWKNRLRVHTIRRVFASTTAYGPVPGIGSVRPRDARACLEAQGLPQPE